VGLGLLVEEVDLDRAVVQTDEGVRSVPGRLVEATEPAPQLRRDIAAISPELAEPTGLRDYDEVQVRALVTGPAGERPLQQQGADALVASRPARRSGDQGVVASRRHEAMLGRRQTP
jgi:hypothetical protein